jgi:hypothetical protein
MKNNAAAVAVAHASEKKPTQRLMDSVSDYKSPIKLFVQLETTESHYRKRVRVHHRKLPLP